MKNGKYGEGNMLYGIFRVGEVPDTRNPTGEGGYALKTRLDCQRLADTHSEGMGKGDSLNSRRWAPHQFMVYLHGAG